MLTTEEIITRIYEQIPQGESEVVDRLVRMMRKVDRVAAKLEGRKHG